MKGQSCASRKTVPYVHLSQLCPFDEFIAALRAGDFDLTFAFGNTDGDAALFAAVEFVGLPLVPAHFQLSGQFFDFFDLLQKPQPFLRTLVMIP